MKGEVSPDKQSNFSAKFGNINIEGRKLKGKKDQRGAISIWY